jgi:hypothetical protein
MSCESGTLPCCSDLQAGWLTLSAAAELVGGERAEALLTVPREVPMGGHGDLSLSVRAKQPGIIITRSARPRQQNPPAGPFLAGGTPCPYNGTGERGELSHGQERPPSSCAVIGAGQAAKPRSLFPQPLHRSPQTNPFLSISIGGLESPPTQAAARRAA